LRSNPSGQRRSVFGSRRFQRCPRGKFGSSRRLTRFRGDRAGSSAAPSVSTAAGCASAWFASAMACASPSSDGVSMAEPVLLVRSTSAPGSGSRSFPNGPGVNSETGKGSAATLERSRSPQIDRSFAGLPRFFFTSTTKGRVGRFIDAFPGENRSHCRIRSSCTSVMTSGPPIPPQPRPPAAGSPQLSYLSSPSPHVASRRKRESGAGRSAARPGHRECRQGGPLARRTSP